MSAPKTIVLSNTVLVTVEAISEDMSLGELRDLLATIGLVMREGAIETIPMDHEPDDARGPPH